MTTTADRPDVIVAARQLLDEAERLDALIQRLRPALATDAIWTLEGIRDRLELIPEQNPAAPIKEPPL